MCSLGAPGARATSTAWACGFPAGPAGRAARGRGPRRGRRRAAPTALARKDRAAAEPWTRRYLELIGSHEGVVARELAAGLGLARDDFKVRVRRVKELGLTESLDVGYRLSPRGRAYLAATADERPAS